MPLPTPKQPEILGLRLIDLEARSCRWPTEEHDEHGIWTFCGKTKFHTSPYCVTHCQMAYGSYVRRV
jgi:hypothetical protein